MAEIMAVTNEADFGSSINLGCGLKFFVVWHYWSYPLEGQENKFSLIGLEMAEIFAVTNKAGSRGS